MTNTPWTAPDYDPFVIMDGARKLADSGVAPLVAAARGYSTVLDKAGVKAIAERSSVMTGVRSLAARYNRMIVDDEDILVIPWYQAALVTEQGLSTKPTTTQLRPSKPQLDSKKGKLAKYEFTPGEQTNLDLHPATPIEWVLSGLQVLITEGVLKADSALTAQLRSAGVSDDELALPKDPATARQTLHDLMLKVPRDQRVPIFALGGVGNWRDHPEWRAIKVSDRKVLVAFDGDTASNHAVWKQAKDVFAFLSDVKHGQPHLVNLSSVEVETRKLELGMDPTEKLGIDDYLTKVGNWTEVLSLAQPNLPDEPPRSDEEGYSVGAWRVNPDHPHIVEEFAQEISPFDGSKQQARWVKRCGIGARIVSSESARRPSQEEITSGHIDPDLTDELSSATCTIEVKFLKPNRTEDDDLTTVNITGPVRILNYPPADWLRYEAKIPPELLMHAEWPPRKGLEWLAAIKANRPEDVTYKNGWEAMGWVPVEGSYPAFIVGNQVIGRAEQDQQRTIIGVTERNLSGASSFGVIDNFFDVDLDAWKKQVRDDIRTVLDTYIESGFWKSRATASAVVAAMLRPTIPARVTATVYLYGPPRAGKTYSAAFIMAGWSATPGTWSVHHLPGAADDTAASTEYALARTPIWVADDFAPSIDRRQSESMEAAISRNIRAVHNHSTRRRMNPDMKQQQIALPGALFVVTAENEPQINSIRERIIALDIPKDAISKDPEVAERMEHLAGVDGAPARLVAAMIRYWTLPDERVGNTWSEKMKTLRYQIQDVKRTATRVLSTKYGIDPGEATRHAEQAADLAISYTVLYLLAGWVGIPEDDPLMSKLSTLEGSYPLDLFELAAGTVKSQRQSTPGRALVQAVALLMTSNRGYLDNPSMSGVQPVTNLPDDENGIRAARMNRALGWTYDPLRATWTPKGVPLGYFGFTGGEFLCLFDPTNTFRAAQQAYPHLIPPGQTQKASWTSVWTEELTSSRFKKRPDSVTTAVRLSDRPDKAASSQQRVSGVPVLWDAINDRNFDPHGEGRFGGDDADDDPAGH